MTKEQKKRMYASILEHGQKLNAIYNTGIEPVDLCKKLRRLENKACALVTDECNNGNADRTKEIEAVKKSVAKLLGSKVSEIPFFINQDPRGYSLKISDKIVIEKNLDICRDWGGFGILAPDFTPYS